MAPVICDRPCRGESSRFDEQRRSPHRKRGKVLGYRRKTDVESGGDVSGVLFAHAGWSTTGESFPFNAYSWAQILPRLKKLVETGERNPFFDFYPVKIADFAMWI
jgi:hypothetical protein